jgi:hypothetical protein
MWHDAATWKRIFSPVHSKVVLTVSLATHDPSSVTGLSQCRLKPASVLPL